MSELPHSGPVPLPIGATVTAASAKTLTLRCPEPVPVGSVVEFDLLLGARPLPAMGRVRACRAERAEHVVELEFLAMAQVDRDSLADFLQAVGAASLRVRPHREE